MPVSAPESGWYADPAGRPDALRWWDGAAWTRWLSRNAPAADPTIPVGPPDQPPSSLAADRSRPADPTSPSGGSSPAGSPPPDPAVRAPLAAALIIGAVLLALVAVGAVVALSSDRLPSGPAVAPPPVVPPKPKTPVTFDPGSRAAAALEFRAVQPGAPYACTPPGATTGLFSSAVSCNAPIHVDYNAKGDDWYASQVFGVLDENVVVAGDPAATANKLASGIATAYYFDESIKVKKRSLKRLVDIAPEGKAVLLVMDFHYRVEGLPSRYDHLVIGVFELADGEFATWLASTPNDSPKRVSRALDASSRTVRAQ